MGKKRAKKTTISPQAQTPVGNPELITKISITKTATSPILTATSLARTESEESVIDNDHFTSQQQSNGNTLDVGQTMPEIVESPLVDDHDKLSHSPFEAIKQHTIKKKKL